MEIKPHRLPEEDQGVLKSSRVGISSTALLPLHLGSVFLARLGLAPRGAGTGIPHLSAKESESLLQLFTCRITKSSSNGKKRNMSNLGSPVLLVKEQPVYECTERHFFNECLVQHYICQYAPRLAPKLHFAWISGEKGYMVMERIRGPTARNWLRDEFGDIKTMVPCLFQLLQRLHAIGLVHGDVHLDNLLLDTGTNTWKLVDFGRSDFIGALGAQTKWHDFYALVGDLEFHLETTSKLHLPLISRKELLRAI